MTTTLLAQEPPASEAPAYPQHLLEEKPPYKPGIRRVPVDRYFKQEFHDLEVERIWKRTWQWACREDDIPEVGDHIVYEVAELSFIVIRTAPDQFKAFWNSCPHRARKIVDFDGKSASELRCMFHGWAWNIDGSVKELTCGWDFKGTRPEEVRLPEVQVGTWGGFVFINPDLDAEPLADFLGELPNHFEGAGHDLGKRWTQVHIVAHCDANWKVVQEAFLEAWHLGTTHPQLLAPPGSNGGYSMRGGQRWDDYGNFMRSVYVANSAESSLPGYVASAETPQQYLNQTYDRDLNEEPVLTVGPDGDAMAVIRKNVRDVQRSLIGDAVDKYHDYHMTQGEMLSVWPNFHPWQGFSRITYRFRPYKNDPDKCMMDVLLLTPWPEDRPKPPAAVPNIIGFGGSIADAKELGNLGRIFVQDLGNVMAVQEGFKTSASGYSIFSDHLETPLRRWHDMYDRQLGLDADGKPGVAR